MVVSVGPGVRNQFVFIPHFLICALSFFLYRNTGMLIPMSVKKGDKVLIPEYTQTYFKAGNTTYGIYSEQDILCKFYDE